MEKCIRRDVDADNNVLRAFYHELSLSTKISEKGVHEIIALTYPLPT